jgi:hypothetical protein
MMKRTKSQSMVEKFMENHLVSSVCLFTTTLSFFQTFLCFLWFNGCVGSDIRNQCNQSSWVTTQRQEILGFQIQETRISGPQRIQSSMMLAPFFGSTCLPFRTLFCVFFAFLRAKWFFRPNLPCVRGNKKTPRNVSNLLKTL